MRAAVFYGPGDLRIEDVPEPKAGHGEVAVRVAYNGICGTDLHEYFHGFRMVPTSPHPLTGAAAPVVLGHEAAGYVAEVGEGVDDLEAGDLVAIEPIISCGTCARCAAGAYNLCQVLAFHGLASGGGGMSERTVVARSMVHKVPAGVDAVTAALVEPMAVSYHGVRRAGVTAGDVVVVCGGGPIGIGAYLALRALGAEVVVSEPVDVRRAALAGLGATHVIDPTRDDLRAAVADLTRGRGAAALIDAAGGQALFSGAFDLVAPQGRIVLVGAASTSLQFELVQAFTTEAVITASTAYCGDFPAVIEAMAAGGYPTDGWVSTVPLEDVVVGGLEPLRDGKAVKVLVDVGGAAA